MLQRNDVWSIFLVSLHVFFFSRIANLAEGLLAFNPAKYADTGTSMLWTRMFWTTILVSAFFYSFTSSLLLWIHPSAQFDARLRRAVTSFLVLVTCVFCITVLPSLEKLFLR